MQNLIDRLSELEAPDREVDAQIYIHFIEPTWHTSPKDPGAVAANKKAFWPEGKIRYFTSTSRTAPLYTGSLDAAIALAARVLPGWGWEIASNTNHIKNCLNPEYGNPVGKHPHWAAVANQSSRKFVDGATPAIALCIALLRAKEASNA